jgi:hypothetical protein
LLVGCGYMSKPLIICVLVLTLAGGMTLVQYAASAGSNTNTVLFVQDGTTEYSEGQIVHLKGTIIQYAGSTPTGISNAYYQIIDADTGATISNGYTDGEGVFTFDWTAQTNGKSARNLQAVFPASGGYEYSSSHILTLQIISNNPTIYHNTNLSLQIRDGSSIGYIQIYPTLTYDSGNMLSTSSIAINVDGTNKGTVSSNQWSSDIYVGAGSHTILSSFSQSTDNKDSSIIYNSASDTKYYNVATNTYHNTNLSLQVKDGSSFGYIQVDPALTYDSGNTLSTSSIAINVDGANKGTVSSNQWSGDIYVGAGSHNIQASFSQSTDSKDSSIIYRSSSNFASYTVVIQSPTQPSNNPNNNNLPINNPNIISTNSNSGIPNLNFPTIPLTIGLVAVGVGTTAAFAIRRKKTISKARPPIGKTPFSTPGTDDTQFYGCPNCGRDTSFKYGKQYCDNCRMYL